MRIGIDMSRTAETKTGLASYAQSLVAALARVDRRNRYVVFPYSWHCFVRDYDRAFCPAAPNFRRSRAWLPRRLVARMWERGKVSKDWLVGDPVDVFFSPFHSVPPRRMGKLVCTFHDVAFRTHPQFSMEWNRSFCEQQIELARRNADRIITVSEFSKEEMVRHVGIPRERITVVLEAADARYRPLPESRVPERIAARAGAAGFLLYVGSVEPRKNLITLVRAYAKLRGRRRVPPLVVAGGSGWKSSDVLEEIEQRGLGDAVVMAGFVTDEELVALYNKAGLFVFPTIYEGFGLPVIEAMSCGCPVLTTRVASIPEVGGDAVAYCEEPTDVDELAAALDQLLEDEGLRQALAEKGRSRAALFSWERAAKETLAVFEAVQAEPDAARHALVVGDDERALERGWHDVERDGAGMYRWTSRRATLALAAVPGSSLLVEVSTPLSEQRLIVRIGREVVARLALAAGWQILRVDPGTASGAIRVTLEVDRPIPASIKGTDPRELGVMVRRVGFW